MGNEAIDIKEINDKWNQLMFLKAENLALENALERSKQDILTSKAQIVNNKKGIDTLTRELRPVLGLRPGPKAKAPRKPRTSKKKTAADYNPALDVDDDAAPQEPEKTWEELKSEARVTATCPHCEKLLANCTCQVSEEAAEKHKKLAKKK